MITLARVLTGGHGDADDLAQEVFVRAWRSLKGFRGESTFRTWLHRVAINVVRTSQAKEGRLRRLFARRSAEADTFDPPAPGKPIDTDLAEIGRASCRERVEIAVGAGALKQKDRQR